MSDAGQRLAQRRARDGDMLRGACSPRGCDYSFRDIARCAGKWVFERCGTARLSSGYVSDDADYDQERVVELPTENNRDMEVISIVIRTGIALAE